MELHRAQRLCDQFELGRFISSESAGGTRNRNFVFHTESGRWLVRQRFSGYCAKGQIDFDHSAARFLHECKVAVPLPRRSLNGQSWWHDGESVWEVHSFVEGRHLRDGNCNDVEALGAALAQWHRAGREFSPRYGKAAPRSETDPQRLRERADQIEREAPECEAAQTSKIVAAYRRALDEAAAELPDEKYFALPHTLIHGDVQPANVLLREGKVAAFVDLDWCVWQVRLYDLCFAILTCCANHDEPFDGGNIWSLTQPPRLEREHIAAFLKAYEDASAPLSRAEEEALQPQLALTWCHMRLSGSLKVAPDSRLEFLQRPPDITDLSWLFPPALRR